MKQTNRAQRRAFKVSAELSASIEASERIRTVNQYSVAVGSVLWDCGYEPGEIKKILVKIWDRFDSFKRGYAKCEDFRLALKEEAGIDFEYAR